MHFSDSYLPRIDAQISGGCGMGVRYLFTFDQPRKIDTTVTIDNIPIQIDYTTKRYLEDEQVTIDYRDCFEVITALDIGDYC